MVKNCDLGLENAALGLRPRAVFSRPRSQFFTIQTSQPANNIYFCGQSTLPTQLKNPNYLVIPLTDAALLFFKQLAPLSQ